MHTGRSSTVQNLDNGPNKRISLDQHLMKRILGIGRPEYQASWVFWLSLVSRALGILTMRRSTQTHVSSNGINHRNSLQINPPSFRLPAGKVAKLSDKMLFNWIVIHPRWCSSEESSVWCSPDDIQCNYWYSLVDIQWILFPAWY